MIFELKSPKKNKRSTRIFVECQLMVLSWGSAVHPRPSTFNMHVPVLTKKVPNQNVFKHVHVYYFHIFTLW